MRKFWRLQLLAGLFVLGICLWLVGSQFTDTVGSLFLRTAVAEWGVIEQAAAGAGLMVRTEETLRATAPGVVTLLVENGQRIRAGQVVAEIRPDAGPHVAEAIAAIDREIAALDQEAQSSALELSRRSDQLKQAIARSEEELSRAIAAGMSDMVEELAKELASLRQQYDTVEREFAEYRSDREAQRRLLLSERAALVNYNASEATIVRSDMPGVVSFSFDGLEEAYVPGEVSDALWEEVDRQSSLQRVRDGDLVAAGAPLFRLIDNFSAYVFVRFEDRLDLRQGQAVWLRWDGVPEPGFRARVLSLHNRPDSHGAWFSLDGYRDAFDELRHLGPVTIVVRRTEGIMVPKSAVGERDGTTGVFLVAEGTPVFRPVSVLASNDRYAIVEPIPAGTKVITNPRRLLRSARRL